MSFVNFMLLIICFILEYYNDNFILVGNKNILSGVFIICMYIV